MKYQIFLILFFLGVIQITMSNNIKIVKKHKKVHLKASAKHTGNHFAIVINHGGISLSDIVVSFYIPDDQNNFGTLIYNSTLSSSKPDVSINTHDNAKVTLTISPLSVSIAEVELEITKPSSTHNIYNEFKNYDKIIAKICEQNLCSSELIETDICTQGFYKENGECKGFKCQYDYSENTPYQIKTCEHGIVGGERYPDCGCICTNTGYKNTETIKNCQVGEICMTAASGIPNNFKNCQNGGTASGTTGSCSCQCAPGWKGTVCNEGETCLNKPSDPNYPVQPYHHDCNSNGQATGTYPYCSCECKDGYFGLLCDQEINECNPNPCKNNGVCIDDVGSFTCDCSSTGFSGTLCDQEKNDCDPNPCQNNFPCVDKTNDYECQCDDINWFGKNCSVPKTCEDLSTTYTLNDNFIYPIENCSKNCLHCQTCQNDNDCDSGYCWNIALLFEFNVACDFDINSVEYVEIQHVQYENVFKECNNNIAYVVSYTGINTIQDCADKCFTKWGQQSTSIYGFDYNTDNKQCWCDHAPSTCANGQTPSQAPSNWIRYDFGPKILKHINNKFCNNDYNPDCLGGQIYNKKSKQ